MLTWLTKLQRKHWIAIGSVFVALLFVALYQSLRQATVIITAPAGASISIGTDKGADLEKAGITKASFKTREFPTMLYIRAEKDGQVTISGVEILEKRKYTVNLELKETTKEVVVLSQGSVGSPLITGSRIQGVSLQYSLTNFRTDAFETQRSAFIGLPYIKKVVWKDADTFAYQTFAGKVGRFIGGQDLGTEYSIEARPLPDAIENISELSDVSLGKNGRLYATSNNYLLVSTDFGATFKPLVKIEALSDTPKLFTTNDSLVVVDEAAPSQYASEQIRRNKPAEHEHASTAFIFGYDGKLKQKSAIEGKPIDIISPSGEPKLITNEGISSNNLFVPLYLTNTADAITNRSTGYTLADNGLWQLSEDGKSLHLIYDISKYGVGLENSLSIYNGKIVVGTTPGIKDEKDNSTMLLVTPL